MWFCPLLEALAGLSAHSQRLQNIELLPLHSAWRPVASVLIAPQTLAYPNTVFGCFVFVFTFVFISKLVCLAVLNTVFGKAKAWGLEKRKKKQLKNFEGQAKPKNPHAKLAAKPATFCAFCCV